MTNFSDVYRSINYIGSHVIAYTIYARFSQNPDEKSYISAKTEPFYNIFAPQAPDGNFVKFLYIIIKCQSGSSCSKHR